MNWACGTHAPGEKHKVLVSKPEGRPNGRWEDKIKPD